MCEELHRLLDMEKVKTKSLIVKYDALCKAARKHLDCLDKKEHPYFCNKTESELRECLEK